MVLLDYPDSEGVTRELAIGHRGRRITGKHLLTLRPVLVLGASAILGLAAILVSQTVFRVSGTGPAPDVHLPVIPFPTVSATPTAQAGASRPRAGRTVPPSTVSLSGSQLTPSAAPAQNTAATQNSATATPSAASTQQAVAVTYAVVALPEDQITAIGGASGYVSNHILLMQPEPGSQPLEPGSELKVFVEAQGPEMTPQLCAFDNTTCR